MTLSKRLNSHKKARKTGSCTHIFTLIGVVLFEQASELSRNVWIWKASPDLATHFGQLFPEGVSAHGHQYMNSDVLAGRGEPALELIWEYVRRAFFADKPSRFSATCAWQTKQEAIDFRAQEGLLDAKIWRLEATNPGFVADMNLLHIGTSTLRASQFAHRYWSSLSWPQIEGMVPPPPRWEVLLTGPVVVAREA